MEKFFQATEFTNRYTECLIGCESFQIRSSNFFNLIQHTIASCFDKIRIRTVNKKGKRKIEDKEFHFLNKHRILLQKSIENSTCLLGKTIASSVLKNVERDMVNEVASRNKSKIETIIKEVQSTDGTFSQVYFWNLKRN